MTATLFDVLMILSLGILAGCGTGLLIGFITRKQKRNWAAMEKKDKITAILLIFLCSSVVIAALAWYLYQYSGT
jgi:NhaP-type Na+/H+ or K+/H+ antiporter